MRFTWFQISYSEICILLSQIVNGTMHWCNCGCNFKTLVSGYCVSCPLFPHWEMGRGICSVATRVIFLKHLLECCLLECAMGLSLTAFLHMGLSYAPDYVHSNMFWCQRDKHVAVLDKNSFCGRYGGIDNQTQQSAHQKLDNRLFESFWNLNNSATSQHIDRRLAKALNNLLPFLLLPWSCTCEKAIALLVHATSSPNLGHWSHSFVKMSHVQLLLTITHEKSSGKLLRLTNGVHSSAGRFGHLSHLYPPLLHGLSS